MRILLHPCYCRFDNLSLSILYYGDTDEFGVFPNMPQSFHFIRYVHFIPRHFPPTLQKTRTSMNSKLTSLTFTALITAILCVLSPIAVPLPAPMPAITLSTFVLYFSGCVLGTKYTCMSLFLYLLLGCAGIPVFANGQAGLQVLIGPTGGYLLGYFFIALLTGWAASFGSKKAPLGMLIGTLLCYLTGTLWLSYIYKLPFTAAVLSGVLPFLPGDAFKLIAAAIITPPVKRQLHR